MVNQHTSIHQRVNRRGEWSIYSPTQRRCWGVWGTCCKFCPQGDVWGVTTSKHRSTTSGKGSHHHVATGPKVGSHHSTHQHNIRQGATSSRHSPEGGLPWRSSRRHPGGQHAGRSQLRAQGLGRQHGYGVQCATWPCSTVKLRHILFAKRSISCKVTSRLWPQRIRKGSRAICGIPVEMCGTLLCSVGVEVHWKNWQPWNVVFGSRGGMQSRVLCGLLFMACRLW